MYLKSIFYAKSTRLQAENTLSINLLWVKIRQNSCVPCRFLFCNYYAVQSNTKLNSAS